MRALRCSPSDRYASLMLLALALTLPEDTAPRVLLIIGHAFDYRHAPPTMQSRIPLLSNGVKLLGETDLGFSSSLALHD